MVTWGISRKYNRINILKITKTSIEGFILHFTPLSEFNYQVTSR